MVKYRVLIIDDDVPMLKFLERLLPWEEMGLSIKTEFSSIRALRVFHEFEPHIVITDIGIPQKDGIQLAAEMKHANSSLRILFLTCHEDFHYAQKAIQMNADNYLIKDELTAGRLRESVEKAVDALEQTEDRMRLLGGKVEIERHKDVLKQSFLKAVLKGNELDMEHTLQLGRKIGIAWRHPDYMIGMGQLCFSSFSEHYRYKDLNIILYAICNIVEDLAYDGITVFLTDESHIMIVHNFKRDLAIDHIDQLEEFLESVIRAAEQYLRVHLTFSCSYSFADIRQVGSTVSKLQRFMKTAYYEEPAIAFMRDGREQEWGLTAGVMLKLKNSWLESYRSRDMSKLSRLLQEAGKEAKDLNMEPDQWRSEASQTIRLLEMDAQQAVDSEAFHKCLIRTPRLADTLALLESRLKVLTGSGTGAIQAVSTAPKLQIIDQYIEEHLSENITSVMIANHLYLNPSYFSRYFKKMTGMNFTDYLHSYKMKLAAGLIRQQRDTIAVISLKLGYSDRTYFSKVFKKYIGVSPSEYK